MFQVTICGPIGERPDRTSEGQPRRPAQFQIHLPYRNHNCLVAHACLDDHYDPIDGLGEQRPTVGSSTQS